MAPAPSVTAQSSGLRFGVHTRFTTYQASTVKFETLPVDVSGRRAPVTQTVGLALPDSIYPVDRRTVSVTVEIRPATTSQTRP